MGTVGKFMLTELATFNILWAISSLIAIYLYIYLLVLYSLSCLLLQKSHSQKQFSFHKKYWKASVYENKNVD